MSSRSSLRLRAAMVIALVLVSLTVGMPSAFAASSWNLVTTKCFARKYTGGTYIDACYQLHKLTNDGSTTRDYFQLTMYGTGKEWTGFSTLVGLEVAAVQKSGSPAQHWVDWTPKSDRSGGSCSEVNIGIAYVASFSYSVQYCPDSWQFSKSPIRGHPSTTRTPGSPSLARRQIGLWGSGMSSGCGWGRVPAWTYDYLSQ